MKIYDFSTCLEKKLLKDTDVALAIGVFDGVHLGHREIFCRLVSRAQQQPGCRSVVITFGTNPKNRDQRPLDTMRLRCQYIESFSVDCTIVIDFSRDFSMISGREFIRLLCTMCRVKAVIVGEDFKCGSPCDSVAASQLSGVFADNGLSVDVIIIPPVQDSAHVRISSTHIRQLISQGDLAAACTLSGAPYRYDLCGNSFERVSDGYITRAVTDQRLPGDGCYRGSLVLPDLKETEVTVCFSSDCMKIVPSGDLDLVRADSVKIFG